MAGYCPISLSEAGVIESQNWLHEKLACFFQQLYPLYLSIIFAACGRQFKL
jgi:hypothetical protein